MTTTDGTDGTTATPRQLRLPGQTAAHEGPLDMAMMYVMHRAFRRDLEAFCAAAHRTPVEDRRTWRALEARWALFTESLHHHHHGEDTWVWPFLLQRVSGEAVATLEAMEAEHEEIDPALTACGAGFTRLARCRDEDARRALAVRLAATKASLGRHLEHEERDAIALMQQWITAEEWEEIEAHFTEGVSLATAFRLVPWVLHELPAEVREGIFARSGTAHRVLWWLTRSRFETLERRAFRHVAD